MSRLQQGISKLNSLSGQSTSGLSGLSRLLVEQRQKGEAARLRYLDSLQWKERMESLVDTMNKRLAMEHERKEQAAADDRHLSQRRRSPSRSSSTGAG